MMSRHPRVARVDSRRRPSLNNVPRLIVGISGASGVIYGIRLLELLRKLPDRLRMLGARPATSQVRSPSR